MSENEGQVKAKGKKMRKGKKGKGKKSTHAILRERPLYERPTLKRITIKIISKRVELECYRQRVAAEHQEKIRQHERRLRQIQRERQAVFDDVFREDLQEYKEKGALTKIKEPAASTVVLEEVVLEYTETKDALEEFLND